MNTIKPTTMLDVFDRNKYNLPQATRASKSWFDQQVSLLHRQNINYVKVARGQTSNIKSTVTPGMLYLFVYDAKHKDTLPYWDKYPLVFPYEKTKDGFIGLNFHYLPYQLRIKLLDKMMVFANNNNMDETTKLRYSWSMISGLSKYKMAHPCIKRYLSSHVQSGFMNISANNWATAMMLPVEGFVGANKNTVWQSSKRMVN